MVHSLDYLRVTKFVAQRGTSGAWREGRSVRGVGVRSARMVTRRDEAVVRMVWPGFTLKHKRETENVFHPTIRSKVVYIDSNVRRGIVGRPGQTISSGELGVVVAQN